MTEKHPPPSTQTAPPTPSLPPLNPHAPAPLPDTPAASFARALPPSAAAGSAPVPASAFASPSTESNGFPLETPVRDAPVPKVEPAEEEEPYTIKCICGFTGDDGTTIYCDLCDSWQHIACFYPNNSEEVAREEFSHACHECKPRPLNVAHAVEYQKKRLQAASAEAAVLHKPKRPPSKSQSQSHKKKAKPSELHINGHAASVSDVSRYPMATQDTANNQHSFPASKKPKNTHKSSHSVGGSHAKRSPSYSASRATLQPSHPLSPATTPPDLPDGSEMYNATDFLTLCNGQDHVQNVQTNSFVSLGVSNATSIWLREPERMLRETGHKFADVFQTFPSNPDTVRRPPRVEVKKRVMGQDTIVHWRYLVTSVAVAKDVPLMELNGQVGFQKDYCSVPANRYEELSCPLPFVFFHPLLPLYIDTRREGSLARYVRRSCRPNAVLDTYLSGGSEYQFWLVSDRHIPADEQITIPWDFRLPHDAKERMLHLLGLGDDDTTTNGHCDMDVEEDEYNSIARWVSLILSRYGGCACDLGPECAFARFHRSYGGKAHHARSGHAGGPANPSKKKASRKPKSHALSPTSTGHATNSRAASEGHTDDLPDADKMSTSSRSKPPSRDMTPAPRQGSFDTLGILTEPTDRDKRKVAMVEDTFRRLEQQQPRKKKRTSDGTSTTDKSVASTRPKAKSASAQGGGGGSRPSGSSSSDQPFVRHGTPSRQYVDAAVSRSKSATPDSAASPLLAHYGGGPGFGSLSAVVGSLYSGSRQTSAGPSQGYVDADTQTDPTEGEWYNESPAAPRPKRRVVSLSRRLLNNWHRARADDTPPQPAATTASLPLAETKATVGAVDASTTANPSPAHTANEDVAMQDAPARPVAEPEAEPQSRAPTSGVSPKAHASDAGAAKASPDLRVQLPRVPSLGDAVLPLAGSMMTPMSASPLVQSPFTLSAANPFSSAVATPSPIKKKMSLSDYTKSRKAAASRPLVGAVPRPSVSSADEPKPAAGPDDATAGGSPTGAEKAADASSTATSGTA